MDQKCATIMDYADRIYSSSWYSFNVNKITVLDMKKAEIKLQIELDDKNVPESIQWSSTDGQTTEELPAKALFLALWDAQYKNSLRIDLWTKDMPYDEMKRFFYETLQTMGDSFLRSSGGDPMAEKVIGDLRDFCAHYADKMDILEQQN